MQQVRCTLLFACMLQTVQPFQFSCSAPRTVFSYRVHATDSSPGCILAECNEGLRVYAGQLEKAKLFTATTSFHISLSSASTAHNITARTIEHEKCTWIFSSGLSALICFFNLCRGWVLAPVNPYLWGMLETTLLKSTTSHAFYCVNTPLPSWSLLSTRFSRCWIRLMQHCADIKTDR